MRAAHHRRQSRARAPGGLRRGAAVAVSVLALACTEGIDDASLDRGQIRQPSGLAVSPDGTALLVSNGNWDRRAAAGTISLVDLVAFDAALARGSDGCRVSAGAPADCRAAAFIDPEQTVVLGDGVGNLAVDRPAGPEGPARLLAPVRAPASVVWVDLVAGAGRVALDCGQDDEGRCDAAHRIESNASNPDQELPAEPGRISVGAPAERFAYLPHLLGGALSLIVLDGGSGPELAHVVGDFFREDIFEDEDLAGGFAVAQRPCDPQVAPTVSEGCSRPVLYGSHRYFPGLRQFAVEVGARTIEAGHEVLLQPVNAGAVLGRPFMADLAFEDETGERLLVVATTPPALVRLTVALDDEGTLTESVSGMLPLCANPNALTIARPAGGEPLALIACRGAARVAAVGLSSFRVLREVAVGEGPSDLVLDPTRDAVWVANTNDSSISLIGLDATRADFLRERARLRAD